MQIFLVYCSDNSDVATNIAANLEKVGIEVILDSRRLENREKDTQLIQAHPSSPILLLISDNYLKDKDCMYQSLSFFKDPVLLNRVTPIVTDGKYVNEQGKVSYQRTKFQKLGDIIRCMNYWQDEYLDLRRKRREDDNIHDTQLAKEINIVQSISSNTAEFFRILGTNHIHFEDVYKNKFVAITKKANWETATSKLATADLIPYIQEKMISKDVEISEMPQVQRVEKASSEVPAHVQPLVTNGISNGIGHVKEEISKLNPLKTEIEKAPKEKVLLEKVIQYKRQEEQVIPKEEVKEDVKVETPKEDYSYRNKSSYELLVALFDDVEEETSLETPVVENNIEESINDVKEEIVEKVELKTSLETPVVESNVEKSIDNAKEEVNERTKNVIESLQMPLQPIEVKNPITELPNIHVGVENQEEVSFQENMILGEEDIEEEGDEDLEDILNETIEEEGHKQDLSLAQDVTNLSDMDVIRLAIENDDTVLAAQMLQTLLSEEPENIEARYEYGMLLADKLNNFGEAKEQFRTILSLDKTNIETNLRLAEIYELEGDFLTAKRFYEQALEMDNKYPGLHHRFALLLNTHFKNQKKNAIRHFKKAVEQDENNTDALYQYALMLQEYLKKPKKAIKQFKKVIAKEPDHPFVNYDVALLYHELEKPKHAAKYYKAAYENNPELKTKKNDEAFNVEKYFGKSKSNDDATQCIIQEEVIDEVAIGEIFDDVFEVAPDTTEHLSIENEMTSIGGLHEVKKIDEDSILAFAPDGSEITLGSDITIDEIEQILEKDTSYEDVEDMEDEEEILEDTFNEEEELMLKQHLEKGMIEVQHSLDEIDEVAELEVPLAEPVLSVPLDEEDTEKKSEVLEGVATIQEEEKVLSFEKTMVSEEVALETEEEKIELATVSQDGVDTNSSTNTLTLITGATSGIGRATAIQFAQKGHHLIITGRRAERLGVMKEELEEKFGIQVEALEFDVRSLDACRQAMDSLDERFKNVDILINNAGLAKGKTPIFEGDIDHWETMIDTNIKGLLYMTRLVAPGMVARGKGHIINIGSIAGKEVYPNGNVYCASKHAVDALTKAMKIDMHKYNIRVSGVHPGAVEETEFSMVRHDFDAEKALDYQAFTPVNSKDIAEIIYFIATRPDHVNIQDVLVTGTQQATATITDNTGRK